MWKSLFVLFALLLCSEQASVKTSNNGAPGKEAAVSEKKNNNKNPENPETILDKTIDEEEEEEEEEDDDNFANLLHHLRERRDFQEAATDPDKPINHKMHVYGTIRQLDQAGKFVPSCGGVLLSSRIVLTASVCAQPQANAMPQLQFSRRGNTYGVQTMIYRPNYPFVLLLLNGPVSPLPEVFAFPSWTGDWQTTDKNWLILPEQVQRHPYRISSYYAAQEGLGDEKPHAGNINTVLNSCNFEDKAERVALKCTGTHQASLLNYIRDGASFFRQITQKPTRAVAIPALVMRGESFAVCNRLSSHQELSFLRLPKAPSTTAGTYVCGLRFNYRHVKTLMQDAEALKQPFADKDVIPNGRKCKYEN